MILLYVEISLRLLTEISSIQLTIELNFSLCSDSIDLFKTEILSDMNILITMLVWNGEWNSL